MAYSYPAMVAWDPNGKAVVKNTVFQVYAPSDTSFTTPLPITDTLGNTLANLNSGSMGVFPAFNQAQYTTVVVSDNAHTYAWTVPAAQTNTVQQWAANTYYANGTPIANPNGDLVTANVNHTTTSTYDSTKYSLSGTYLKTSPIWVLVPPPTGVQATDTANLQNALNQSTNGNPKRIILQAGTYQLNAALNIPMAPGTAIIGQGPAVTAIRQADGLHVFSFTHDTTHTITVEGIDIGYNNPQTTSCAVFYYHVTGGTSAGFWNHVYRDLFITYAYDGWRLEENDGPQTLWEAAWYNVRTNWGLGRSFVRMNPAGAVGIPELNFYNVATFHTPTVAGAQAFVFKACEVQMTGVGVETYTDTAFYVYGGGFLNIRNMHVESHKFNAAQSVLFSIYDTTEVSVDGFSISGTNASTNNAFLILFNAANAGPSITLKNGTHNVTTTSGTPYVTEVAWNGSGLANTTIRTESVIKSGGGLNNPLQGPRGSQVAEYSPPQLARQYRSVTAAYSQQAFDGVIVVNATSAVTVTLLDPTACPVGVPITVKNVTANTVTVASAGTSKTLDGAASTTLAQWAKATFISDGTQWLSV